MTGSVVFLTLAQALAIHRFQIQTYGGSDGIRDRELLESALAQPQAGFGDEYLHRDVYEMGAAYLYHLCKNHPFVDGNKRVALHAAMVFLTMNGVRIAMPHEDTFALVHAVATGQVDKAQLAEVFRNAPQR